MTNDGSKVALSAFEQELVANSAWLHAKRAILDKTALVLGDVANSVRPDYDAWRAVGVVDAPWMAPKISRGESYEWLPWLMLDFPREFHGSDWLAIRHFFGWGQGFTVSLLLRGQFLFAAMEQVEQYLPGWQSSGWSMVVAGDPWQHGWKPASQRPMQELSPQAVRTAVGELGFFQIRKHLPVQDWAGAVYFMREIHQELRPLMKGMALLSYPSGGTSL